MSDAEWTTKPPTKPGWYWTWWIGILSGYMERPEIRYHAASDEPIPSSLDRIWYPIPIPEPPRKEPTC